MVSVNAYAQLLYGVRLSPMHQQWVTRILEHKRVGIVAPPESWKTLVVSTILMGWWIGKHPWDTNMTVSAGEKLALEMGESVAKAIEKNPKWKLCFPNVVPDKDAGWSRDGWEVRDLSRTEEEWSLLVAKKKDPTLIAGGVGSDHLNGRRVSGLCVGDDMHSRESKKSQRVCDDTVEFVTTTLSRRVMPEAKLAIVQTRWNPKDVIAHYDNARMPDGTRIIELFVHPAIVDEKSFWPEEFPIERLEAIRAEITEEDFKLIYLADDKASVGNILKKEDLKFYPFNIIRNDWQHYMGVDLALRTIQMTGTKNKDPDNTAIAVGVDAHSSLVLIDGWFGRELGIDIELQLIQMANIFNPVRIYVETNSKSDLWYQNLLKRLRDMEIRLPLIPVVVSKNKGVRINDMLPDFQWSRWMVSSASNAFLNRFQQEWVRFGDKSFHDDTLDAMYMLWLAAQNKTPAQAEDKKKKKTNLSPFAQIDKRVFA